MKNLVILFILISIFSFSNTLNFDGIWEVQNEEIAYFEFLDTLEIKGKTVILKTTRNTRSENKTIFRQVRGEIIPEGIILFKEVLDFREETWINLDDERWAVSIEFIDKNTIKCTDLLLKNKNILKRKNIKDGNL